MVSPKQLKIHQHYPQVEGINKLPDSDTLNIGFININGLYPAKEYRMLEVSQYMNQNKIDIFGLAETNLHWNNGEIYKYQQRKFRSITQDPKAQIITSDTRIPWKKIQTRRHRYSY